ncbi:16S rRNA (guanine(527)-N(7))-methyltransferase RsmG [Granulicoccus phenolivorans]|uniref:16S rRNA (guanine(527)-N(7))-methyltransferase RsmG n=1 Tax=Granulicoccus phenolivorans TaxID=266854 RepID=UPI0004102A47|nr:16S rRNA (guanine(527)-N(7))-methyltransferase RsmG [Granulicoccus phenolivorans]
MSDKPVDQAGDSAAGLPAEDISEAALTEIFGDRVGAARAYHELLATDGIEWGLLGPREGDRLWQRHILNSAALGSVMPQDASVVDVGSGAGLPGIPLALVRPDLRVTLLEPLERRVAFLTRAVDKLGISDRVDIVRARAEEHKELYDVATSRAVGPLKRLLPWCLPLMRPRTGEFIALKGASVSDELRAVDKLLAKRKLRASIVSVRAHPTTEATTALRIAAG